MINNEMDIKATKDYTLLSEAEILNQTDNEYSIRSIEYNQTAKYERILEKKADEYLKLKSNLKWDYLWALKESEYFVELSYKSTKFYCSSFVLETAFLEKSMNLPISCSECRSLIDIEEFYIKIAFILRRIELNYEDINDCLLLSNMNISYVYIGQLLYCGKLENISRICIEIYERNLLSDNNSLLLIYYLCNLANINDEIILDLCVFLLRKGEILYGRDLLLLVKNRTDWISENLEKLDSKINEV